MSDNALQHIAIIMDGNSRWAKQRGLLHINGHKAGVERIRDMLSVCRDNQVTALTLFAFSSENWQRPKREVDALMRLFHNYLTKEAPSLQEEGVRLEVVGCRTRFSDKILSAIENAEAITAGGKTHLVIAADYGGRWDMAQSAQTMAYAVQRGELDPAEINETCMNRFTSLRHLPEVDLLIRTGGELRLSNFLLWQSAYAELVFSERLWPDFAKADLEDAIEQFHSRHRRFGLTQEQREAPC